MDIILRGEMDGIETAKELIRKYCTAIIYITAYSDDEIIKRVMFTNRMHILLNHCGKVN